MARLFGKNAKLLASSRACVVASERLLASIRAGQKTRNVLTTAHACIAETKLLLDALTIEKNPAAPMDPDRIKVRTRPDRNSPMLAVRVFQEGLRFSWTLNAPSDGVLGCGTAATEQKARIDALWAGMTYIDRAKGRSSSSDTSLH